MNVEALTSRGGSETRMRASVPDDSPSFREAIDSMVDPGVIEPLDELGDLLLVASGSVARLLRWCRPDGGESADIVALDEAFSGAIARTRALREGLLARRSRGEYASVSHVAREVVGRLQGVLPYETKLSLECPLGHAIVAADASDLRRVIAGLVGAGLEALADEDGRVDLDVTETLGLRNDERRKVVLLELRAGVAIEEGSVRIEETVRPLVRALGGTVLLRHPVRGATVISVRLPRLC